MRLTKMKMKTTVKCQTTNCIKCGRPAKTWGGAVQLDREWVLAGWCGRCLRARFWFHGDYSPRYGRERAK